ncbi:hypothetical protein [Bradyrhizobium sp.]|uniref:hypothetical protein n=1 Tax=Bradyrhizobium sp. TaxID=376 RepID=UPI0025C307FF|nr:hypothetical protein [Bradyrhizobium sp.]
MGLTHVFAAVLGATLVVSSGGSIADEYRPGEFLGLDLSSALLSPKPLGPATQFAPVRIEARADRASPAPSARVTPAKTPVANQRADKPRGGARTKLARPRGNPLDAQASDTRVQAWPCKSGGICNWK